MNNSVLKISEHSCTGCGACYNKCPAGAIRILPNKDGYIVPQIDGTKCTDCGACLRACPAVSDTSSNIEKPRCLAVCASDEIRQKSSSGGVFTLLAEAVFEMGGVVFGSAFTDDFYGAEHRVATNMDELSPLRGSKYVQSNIGTTYRQAKEYLEQGRAVLYTGCPCQIAGLYGYLGKDYDKLYTADLVCHGVPSASLLERFVKEEEEKVGAKATYLSFRDKAISPWGDYRCAIDFDNGEKYRKGRNECAWFKSFLGVISMRKSCGSCKFASLPRRGDVTMADFWDIHRYNESFDDKKGTSLVLVNNSKGAELLERIKPKTKLFEDAPLDHAIEYNRQICYSSVLHKYRDHFLKALDVNTFENAVELARINPVYDVGFIGWWYGKNWGSMMTCFALNRALTDLGNTVLMLPFPDKERSDSRKQGEYVRNVAERFYNEAPNCNLENYHMFNHKCKTFVVGSDQLWNWWSNNDIGSYYYFGDFVESSHKLIAYSTSFGHETGYYPEDMIGKISLLLSKFDAISVREESGIDILNNKFGIDAELALDPVFICWPKHYEELVSLSSVELNEKFALAYLLNPNEEKVNSIKHTAAQLGLPYKIIVDGQEDFENLKSMTNDDENVIRLERLEDWLNYFYNAEHIVTDSFHGFCFSMIFKKQSTIFPNKLRGLARFETIDSLTGLGSRFVYSFDEVKRKALWKKKINYAKIGAKLGPHIERSVQWLRDALSCKKKKSKEGAMWEVIERDRIAFEKRLKDLSEQVEALKAKIDVLGAENHR